MFWQGISAAPWNGPSGLMSCLIPILILQSGMYTCRWFSSWILELLSQENSPNSFILPSFITDVFHCSQNFSLGIWGKLFTAVQPRLGPWVLTLSPADQGRFYLALLQPRCVRQDLSETLALPQPSSCSSAELPDEHVWSYCIMKSSEREEKYTKTEKYNSEGTTEKNSPFPQVNTQPQMGGLLVRVKHCHTLLPVITIINPTWPAKLQGHTLIFPIMFSWLPREALQQRRASKFHLQWQECK